MSNKIPTAKTKIDETKAEQEKLKLENNSWKQKCQLLTKTQFSDGNRANTAAHDTCNQFDQKKTPAALPGATNSLEVGCGNVQKTNKMDRW